MSYLAAPVHTLTDFQAEFNGLLMGSGTPFSFPPTWTFLDMAAVKSMDQARTWADGSWSGPDFADVLLPGLDINVKGADPASFAAAVATLRNTFSPQLAASPLWVKIPGFAAMGIPAKTNQRVIPIGHAQMVMTQAMVQFRCPDPTWQSTPRTATLAASATAVSGLVAPLGSFASGTYAAPGVLDAGSQVTTGSAATLLNAGNTPAWPVAVITGPTTQPFSIIIDGNTVTYSQPIPAGQSVTIDYRTGLATLTGNVDRTGALTSRNFSAVSSSSSALFSSSAGTCALTIADMWR